MKQLIPLLDSVCFSYAQIFFSNRRWFGAIVLAASFVEFRIGMMALLGVLLANTLAAVLKFDEAKIRSGFYGFNGLLLGAAALYYYELNWTVLFAIVVFIILTFLLTSVIENYLAVAVNLPGLSLPFVVSLYILIIYLQNFSDLKTAAHNTAYTGSFPLYVTLFFKSLSLIILQSNIFSGLIIFAGLFVFSRVLFLLSISSFAAGMAFLYFIFPAAGEYVQILTGFNSILIGLALGGSLIIPSRKSFALSIIAAALNVIIIGFFLQFFKHSLLPVLVLPFNFIVLFTLYGLKFRQSQSGLTLLYFPPGTPEENYYYHANKKDRFQQFKTLFPELPVYGEWKISQGFNGKHTHKEQWKYAWDFVVVDEKGNECSGDGKQLEQYYCQKLPVVAPLDGEVVKVSDGIPNNEIGDVNIEKNWGNTVIIRHEQGVYSALSHLEPDSLQVKAGDPVEKGQIVGLCGNSGRSPSPHLHFQFQQNDTIGSHTLQYPFAHYLQKADEKLLLKTFEYPAEDAVIQNLETHKLLKDAFDFKLGNEYLVKGTRDGKQFEEKWEVKITLYNSLYIESDSGASVIIYTTPKVFYLTDFVGPKNSALYYFYLSALQVPLCYHTNLTWADSLSPALFPATFLRYATEFFLLFVESIHVSAEYLFIEPPAEETANDIHIGGTLTLRGAHILNFFRKSLKSELRISREETRTGLRMLSGETELINAIITMN